MRSIPKGHAKRTTERVQERARVATARRCRLSCADHIMAHRAGITISTARRMIGRRRLYLSLTCTVLCSCFDSRRNASQRLPWSVTWRLPYRSAFLLPAPMRPCCHARQGAQPFIPLVTCFRSAARLVSVLRGKRLWRQLPGSPGSLPRVPFPLDSSRLS